MSPLFPMYSTLQIRLRDKTDKGFIDLMKVIKQEEATLHFNSTPLVPKQSPMLPSTRLIEWYLHSRKCPRQEHKRASATIPSSCFGCGKDGHFVKDYPEKDSPKAVQTVSCGKLSSSPNQVIKSLVAPKSLVDILLVAIGQPMKILFDTGSQVTVIHYS